MVLLIAWLGSFAAGAAASVAERPEEFNEPISSKHLMELAGIGEAQWARFDDSTTWNTAQDETLQKILLRLAQLPVDTLERMAMPIDTSHLVSEPTAYRGSLVRLQGRVTSVEAVRLSKELTERFDMREYYRVGMELKSSAKAIILARTVPKAWCKADDLDQPAAAWAMFVKIDQERPNSEAIPVFAAARVEAFAADRAVGRLGVDTGLLDELVDRKPWQPQDRECFYQVLAAAARTPEGQLEREATEQLARTKEDHYSVEPLFNDPASQRGNLVMLTGTARRVVRIMVDEPDIQQRFGIDHYYEVDLFTGDSQGNPIVCCVAHLPKGMPTGEGPDYAEPVRVAGFFLKSWAYPLREAAGSDDEKKPLMQLAPLIVGREAQWLVQSRSNRVPIWGLIAPAAFVLVLLVIWIWLLRLGRGNRQFRRRRSEEADRSDRLTFSE